MKCKKILFILCIVFSICLTGCENSNEKAVVNGEKTPKELLAEAFVKFGEIKSYDSYTEDESYYIDQGVSKSAYNCSVVVKNDKIYSRYLKSNADSDYVESITIDEPNISVRRRIYFNDYDDQSESAEVKETNNYTWEAYLNYFEKYKYMLDPTNDEFYEFSMRENEEGFTEITVNELYSEELKNKRYCNFIFYEDLEYIKNKVIFTIDKNGNIVREHDEYFEKLTSNDEETYYIIDTEYSNFNHSNINTDRYDEIFENILNYQEGDYIVLS